MVPLGSLAQTWSQGGNRSWVVASLGTHSRVGYANGHGHDHGHGYAWGNILCLYWMHLVGSIDGDLCTPRVRRGRPGLPSV